MPYIKQVSDEQATGAVKRELDAAVKRAGRVWNIVRIMTPNADVMRTSMSMYSSLMHGGSPLSRAQREMLAVVVSKANHCVYWTQAHAHDLRAEVNWFETDAEADAYVNAIARNWREAHLSAVDAVLCSYAEKLTLHPTEMSATDIQTLRDAGLDDRTIHDATQVIAYFNYINRIADALGVEPESFIPPWGER